jgi:hypothetical protein
MEEDDFYKRLDKEIINLVKEKIDRHTCQILSKGGQYGHQPHATGVLVNIGQQHFLFTASHALDKSEHEPLFINSDTGMIEISGDVKQTNLETHDNLDVGYVILDPRLAKKLAIKYTFLPQDLIRRKYADESSYYLSAGYPEVNIKAEPENNIIRTGLSFTAHPLAKDHVYDFYKLDKRLNIALEYSGVGTDMLTGLKKKNNLTPHGISGGGLWHIAIQENEKKEILLDYRLAGVMTKYIKSKYFVLVANNVDIILAALQTFHGIRI